MTIMKIDHIGIAVKNLEEAIQTYEKLLNWSCNKREIVEGEQVETAFFETGQTKVELLGAISANSAIEKFISKKGEGIHHVAFEVEDLESEMERLTNEGFTLLNSKPKIGAGNKRIVFLHPKDNHGVLVELCEPLDGMKSEKNP